MDSSSSGSLARLRFSEHFEISIEDSDDFFDPLLNLDTALFLDPFLVQAQEFEEFVGAQAELVAFFQDMFEQAAGFVTPDELNTPQGRAFLSNLVFPEFQESCLGLTAAGTRGSGGAAGTARAIGSGLIIAVAAGVCDASHFEQIGILAEKIGPDRISDAVSNILRHRFAAYTNRIATAKAIPVRQFNHPSGRYDATLHRWVPLSMSLPVNPYTDKAIILMPHRYLRRFPSINADDFWDYSYDNALSLLRERFGAEISRSVNKDRIIDLARSNPSLLREYTNGAVDQGAEPYDLRHDPDAMRVWYDSTRPYVAANPIRLDASTSAEFQITIESMLGSFKHFVEQNGGWNIITDDGGRIRHEEVAQRTLLGVVLHQCAVNNIDVTPEANIGRGPVDFKFSRGAEFKVLVEVKLARNTRFWHGLRDQLPTYLRAESRRDGWFVIVAQASDREWLEQIRETVGEVNVRRNLNIRTLVVYADRPASASRA